MLSISSPGVHFGDDDDAASLAQSVNDAAARHVRHYPDRFRFFASVPVPNMDAAIRETRRSLDNLGAVGVALESNAHGQYLGHPAMEPLWAELDARKAAVFVHPTSPVGWEQSALGRPRPMLEFMFDNTRSIVDLVFSGVLDRYPDMKVIVPHAGAVLPALSDRIALFQRMLGTGTTAWQDAMNRFWFDMAGTPFPTAVPVLEKVAGSDHILYGSDSCWTPAAGVDAQLESIDAADAPRGVSSWRKLATANAERLFGSRL